ncbi:MAG: threonine--tRNA ligase [Syntrophobacterales bacterium]|nr:MAG: threonine--tRNA ligase [Syntrophobacterales bacterium]
MEQITITISDGSQRRVNKGTTISDLVKALGKNLADQIVAGRIDGQLVDLNTPLECSVSLDFVTLDSEDGLNILRHGTSHVMAYAVKELFKGVKVSIGPAIEKGFYYDFDYEGSFTPDDLPRIEEKMAELIKRDIPFVREEISKAKAVRLFEEQGETYKVEILKELNDEPISIYRSGDFVDLCRGPHIPSTRKIKAYKLLSIAGAYWRGDERNKMLQRIYGTAFADRGSLEDYLGRIEEAQRRDHRKLGRELDLFSINEEAGAGLVLYHPKGALLRTIIEDFEKKEHLRRGYHIVMGPQILKRELWEKSGHLENYRELMYFTRVEEGEYALKPMNCLAHMLIFKSKIRSYRDLPIRYFELGKVHRHERSGVLHGLLRVREFTQDDAHILCSPDQLNDEIKGIIELVIDFMKVFGFHYDMEISTRPEKSIGTDQDWERATAALLKAIEDKGLPYSINEGEGAFYGPKIDVKLEDALGRYWQCATIQCDFTLPERFDLYYIGKNGEKNRPVMLHRTIIGTLERFIGVLIEHYGGAFPTWLAPVQGILLTITDKNISYAEEVFRSLLDNGIRVEKDFRNEKLGLKVREAQLMKIPYMLVIGNQEEQSSTISPRTRTGEQLRPMKVEEFVSMVKRECLIDREH